ncbi:MAG: PEP-CTERM sorting domain-containing protein, partial [Akkermansia sp.]|nr:PEP-CTERM sorting domain-containing protein [Akkermansia sp.]
LSHLFQCTVEGDLNFDVDTEALVAAGYTGVELDFGSDADEDYSNLTLSMDGATYEGTEGNVAGFTLPTIPEPSTATLSLLALAALASRRRRG